MPSPRHTSLAMGDLLDILPDAVLMVDAYGRITYANPAVRALLGYTPDEIFGQPLSVLVPHDLRERHEALVARFRRDGQPMMMGSRPVLHAVHRSGHMVPVSISLCSLSLDDGERVSVAVVHNVSTMKTHLDRATAKAETDALTGLGNRLRLSRRIQAQQACARPFALLCLDLERVKQPDDVHEREIGDEALRIIGLRLQAQVRDVDLVVRLGGDDFVLLLDGLSEALQLRERALSVAHSLTRPLRVGAASAALGLNIGGAISPHHGASAQALLAAAGQAMGRAKQAGEGYRLAGEV